MMAHFAEATAKLSALDETENQLYQHSQALAARLQQLSWKGWQQPQPGVLSQHCRNRQDRIYTKNAGLSAGQRPDGGNDDITLTEDVIKELTIFFNAQPKR